MEHRTDSEQYEASEHEHEHDADSNSGESGESYNPSESENDITTDVETEGSDVLEDTVDEAEDARVCATEFAPEWAPDAQDAPIKRKKAKKVERSVSPPHRAAKKVKKETSGASAKAKKVERSVSPPHSAAKKVKKETESSGVSANSILVQRMQSPNMRKLLARCGTGFATMSARHARSSPPQGSHAAAPSVAVAGSSSLHSRRFAAPARSGSPAERVGRARLVSRIPSDSESESEMDNNEREGPLAMAVRPSVGRASGSGMSSGGAAGKKCRYGARRLSCEYHPIIVCNWSPYAHMLYHRLCDYDHVEMNTRAGVQ